MTRASLGLPRVKRLERACLVQIHGPDLGRAVFLDEPLTTFGRGMDCDVVLELDNVSRRHCTIISRADGIVVRDDASTNGTFVNDERVHAERVLRTGDLLRLGSVVFTLYRLTITDALTGLFNRAYLLRFLEREVILDTRYRRPLAVLLIDIDHFKDVNDQYGHLAGDLVLRELAAILRARTRREECLARYGGEELCLILPEATHEDAIRRGDDLRRVCEGHEFVFEGVRIPVTFSGGMAAMSDGDAAVDLLKAADERLYAANAVAEIGSAEPMKLSHRSARIV